MKKCCSLKLDRCIYRGIIYDSRQLSTEAVFIENYEIQISKFVFHTYLSYLCRVSFLTAIDATWCKGIIHEYCDQRHALVHLSLEEVAAFVRRRVLWPSFLIFIVWMNCKTLQPTSFLSWCVDHVLGSMHRLVSHILEVVHWKERLSLHYKSNCVLG